MQSRRGGTANNADHNIDAVNYRIYRACFSKYIVAAGINRQGRLAVVGRLWQCVEYRLYQAWALINKAGVELNQFGAGCKFF